MDPTSLSQIVAEVAALGNPERARSQARFFKTGPGEYAEGDQFAGVTVPLLRKLARRLRDVPLSTLEKLLERPIHEERLLALLVLVDRYRRGGQAEREQIYSLYLRHTATINNWDLVDSSAADIVGAHLDEQPGILKILAKLARSESLWERRIAMVSTYYQIKRGRSEEALHVAGLLLGDRHDLIHKAVGWMLREVGQRCSVETLERFLRERHKALPRTALRYAIEHFSPTQRQQYLAGDW